jgi:hypothetical protein
VRRTGCRVVLWIRSSSSTSSVNAGRAVIATRGAVGAPQAALVGITATGRGELSSTRVEVLGSTQPVRLGSCSAGHWLGRRADRAARGTADGRRSRSLSAGLLCPVPGRRGNGPRSRHRARSRPPVLAAVQRLPARVFHRGGDHFEVSPKDMPVSLSFWRPDYQPASMG